MRLLFPMAAILFLLGVTISGANAETQPKDPVGRSYLASFGASRSMMLVFTHDLAGVKAARVQDLEGDVVRPDLSVFRLVASEETFYRSPIAVTDGAFEIRVSSRYLGMIDTPIRVEGAFDGNTLHGTATPMFCDVGSGACTDYFSASWTATEAPPESGRRLSAQLDGHDGRVIVSLDGDSTGVRSVTLLEVPLTPCTSSEGRFSGRFNFDPPASPSSFDATVRSVGSDGLLLLRVRGSVDAAGATHGTFGIVTPRGSCRAEFVWDTLVETATPVVPNAAATAPGPLVPELPPAGSGPSGHGALAMALLGLAAGGTLLAANALRRVKH
jgi:hypothetical protein